MLKKTENGMSMNEEQFTWLFVFFFWGIGDIATTFIGIEFLGLTESNPYMLQIHNSLGYIGMISLKIIVGMSMVYLTNLIPERKYRIRIAEGVSLIGIIVVINNIVAFYIVA